MTELACSFAAHCNSACGVSESRFPDRTQFYPLTSCSIDVRGHLRILKTTQSCVSSEKELILVRAGYFEDEGLDMTICPKHRASLGVMFSKGYRPRTRCKHPLHVRKTRKADRGMNLKTSKEIKQTWNVLVPVGSGICKTCRVEHSKYVKVAPVHSDTSLTVGDYSEMEVAAEPIQSEPQSEQSPELPVMHVRFRDDLLNEYSDPSSDTMDPFTEVMSTTSSGSQVSTSTNAAETSAEWQPTPQIQHRLNDLNNFLRKATDGRVSPVRSQCTVDVMAMSTRTQRYYRKKAEEAIEGVLESIAPGNASWLYQQVLERHRRLRAAEGIVEDTLVSRLVELYEDARYWYTKQQILSLFVTDYSKSELLALIPCLSKWRIDEARKHAFEAKPGQPIEQTKIIRARLDSVKVDHFLDFLSSPSFLQDVAYGTRMIKLENGETVEIPNMVRTVIASHLVRMYQKFCAESALEPLGRSTLFNIIKVCAASQKRSLAGLDSTQTDGVQAFNTLEDMTRELCRSGLDSTMGHTIIGRLKTARQYLKSDFKLHTAGESPCADHCRVYALSSTDVDYKGQCPHEHRITCDRCEEIKNVISDLQLAMTSTEVHISPDKLEELQHDIGCAVSNIEDWKLHVLRSVHQDQAKSTVVNQLKSSQVLLIMDWAMKFIPTSFRETQRDWFGKKGKPWHISVAITKGGDGQIETRTYIHLLEECNQNWYSVASIIEHTLSTIKRTKPQITEAFLCSDNAGCYHCAPLILSLPSLGECVGVRISRYDFSEPQAGKDICDRRAAAVKSHMRRYINEGHDVKTARDMKAALDSHGGVKGCYSVVCHLNLALQTMTKHKMTGIQSMNNFQYAAGQLTTWRAYNVGAGKIFTSVQLSRFGTPQGPTDLEILVPFSSPDVSVGVFRAPSTSSAQEAAPEAPSAPSDNNEDKDVGFACPEEGCIKVYQAYSTLQRHLDVGKHLLALERETTYDTIKKKWADTCRSLTSEYIEGTTTSGLSGDRTQDMPTIEEVGWALKRTRKSAHFTNNVREYLRGIFLQGEESGNKAVAEDISAQMRSMRTAKGTKAFTKDEWLTPVQVSRYFSRLSALNKSGQLPRKEVAPPEEEMPEAYMAERPIIRTRRQIRRELEL